MTDPVVRLARAEAAAAAARARLNETLTALRPRLKPKRLTREIVAAGETAARRNPGTLAGLIAAAGLFLARRRLVALVRSRQATLDDAAS